MMPAAIKASCELCRKTTIVSTSSEKTTGIRSNTMTRKRPKPIARSIPIGMCVMDKLTRIQQISETNCVSHRHFRHQKGLLSVRTPFLMAWLPSFAQRRPEAYCRRYEANWSCGYPHFGLLRAREFVLPREAGGKRRSADLQHSELFRLQYSRSKRIFKTLWDPSRRIRRFILRHTVRSGGSGTCHIRQIPETRSSISLSYRRHLVSILHCSSDFLHRSVLHLLLSFRSDRLSYIRIRQSNRAIG